MQQLASRPPSDQQASRGGAPRSQVILIVALLLFSVAGLASGFSVAALSRPQHTAQSNNQSMPSIQSQTKKQPSPQTTKTVDIATVGIGCPKITSSSYTQVADNTSTYTVNAQVLDKSIENKTQCGKGKPLLASGITCKIWITKDVGSLSSLQATSNKMLMDTQNLKNTFPHEKVNILLLNRNNQVQDCNPSGETGWKYTIASNTNPGTYFIAVLADWKGLGWNWSWILINITKAR